ncbi:MAG TPA: response regulator [Caldimonas sp.]|nr:response regulator [Caldimonas sp.]
MLRRQLELLGHAAEFAENGLVALGLWRTGQHALLLTDLHMPEMDGYALARTIRSEEASRGGRTLPILALSANALKGEAARARAVGFDDYLVKPVSLNVLQDALCQRLPATAGDGMAEEALPTSGASRVLNLNTLRGLIGDDESAVRALLSVFLPSARANAFALSNALRTGDLAVIGAIAHKLDSSSRSVGATALADICARLKSTDGDAHRHLDPGSQTRFDAAFAAAETAVVAYLETTPA